MTIICDFDHTLFSATRFKNALANSLIDLGINKKDFSASYQGIVKRDKKKYDYDYQMQAETLAKKFGVSKEKIIKKLERVIKKTKSFLYADADDFLEKLRKNNAKLVILTLGNASFQKMKFKFSGLKKYFADEHFVERIVEKNEILAETFKTSKNVYYLNDNPTEIIQAKKQFPQIKILYIQRPDGKYRQKINNIEEFNNLDQILNFLNI